MAPLPTGNCETCTATDEKLRTNPFTRKAQCEKCRTAEIIGVTDVKFKYNLKDADLEKLKMASEAKEAFLGGPDRRWYLVKEVEDRAEEKVKEDEMKAQVKEAAKKAKEQEKEAKAKEKEEAKKAKMVAREVLKKARAEEKTVGKRKRNDQVEDNESVKRGRGRPRKEESKKPATQREDKPKRGRGRPPKAKD